MKRAKYEIDGAKIKVFQSIFRRKTAKIRNFSGQNIRFVTWGFLTTSFNVRKKADGFVRGEILSIKNIYTWKWVLWQRAKWYIIKSKCVFASFMANRNKHHQHHRVQKLHAVHGTSMVHCESGNGKFLYYPFPQCSENVFLLHNDSFSPGYPIKITV